MLEINPKNFRNTIRYVGTNKSFTFKEQLCIITAQLLCYWGMKKKKKSWNRKQKLFKHPLLAFKHSQAGLFFFSFLLQKSKMQRRVQATSAYAATVVNVIIWRKTTSFFFFFSSSCFLNSTFTRRMKNTSPDTSLAWQCPLSPEPQASDMMCTAATRVSPPISMSLLSARPSCRRLSLFFWGGNSTYEARLSSPCFSSAAPSSVFVREKGTCQPDTSRIWHARAHVHVHLSVQRQRMCVVSPSPLELQRLAMLKFSDWCFCKLLDAATCLFVLAVQYSALRVAVWRLLLWKG